MAFKSCVNGRLVAGGARIAGRGIYALAVTLFALVILAATDSRANPFAEIYGSLPTVSAESVSVNINGGSFVDSAGQTVVTNSASVTFTNLRSSEGYVAARFAMTFGRIVGTGVAFLRISPASEPVLRDIPGMIDVSFNNVDLNRPFSNTVLYDTFGYLPYTLRRTVLATIAQLPGFLATAGTVSRTEPAQGAALWTHAQAATLADRFVKAVYGNTLRAGPIYSGAQTEAQSVLRFHNTGNTAGTVTVTFSDLATGSPIRTWTSPVLNPRVAEQFPIQDIEATFGNIAKPAHYAISVRTGITGAFQHVLRKTSDGTLTNLTTCDAGIMADPGHLNHVHSSRLDAVRPSSVVVTNTSSMAAVATLGIYDARNGTKLGVYTSSSIAPGKALQLSVAEIEKTIGRTPSEGMDHYVIKVAGAFPGTLQHLVTNVSSGVTSDMSQVCSLGLTYPVDPLPSAHVGVIPSTKQSDAQSFLRFYNGGDVPGRVAVELADAATGQTIGTWTSPVIPPRAVANHFIADVEIGAGAPAAKPDAYKVRVTPGIAGHFQHILWRPGSGTIVNRTTCDGGALLGPMVLTSVHTSNVSGPYPSTLAVMNTSTAAASASLGIYDARSGEKLNTYTTPPIPAGGGRLVPVSDLEAGAGIAPGDMVHYVVRMDNAFVGYLQNMMGNTQAGVVVDMGARCLMDPAQAEGRAEYFAATDGDDGQAGTLAQPFRTIQKCASTVSRGGTCYVRAGRYTETVTPNSGITIAAYNGENVTIDGTDAVTGWSAAQGNINIYVASAQLASADHNQLFVGQQMMTEARWPNGDDLFHPNWAQADAGTNDTTLVDLQLLNLNYTGAIVNFWSGWSSRTFQTAAVTSSVFPRLTHKLDIASSPPNIMPMAGGRYYFFGSRALLDVQREWSYDHAARQISFWAPGGVNPNALNVRVKKRELAVDLRGKTGVRVQGLNLFAATIKMDESSSGNIIDGVTAEYVSHFTRSIDSPLTPGSGRYNNIASTGIVLNGSRNSIENSTVGYSGGNGIAVYGTGNLVRNNLIHHVAYRATEVGGIAVRNHDHLIHRNTIRDVGADGIFMDATSAYAPLNIDIGYNNIYRTMLLSDDGGGIYVGGLHDAGRTSRIHHNWIHDIQSPLEEYGGLVGANHNLRGVYFDTYATGWETDQNIIWNTMAASVIVRGDPAGANVRPSTHTIHNNSVIDIDPDSEILVSSIATTMCGTLNIADNYVLVSVRQASASCTLGTNGSSSPGANEMVGANPGCNFSGCESSKPPLVTGGLVRSSVAYEPYDITVPAGQVATFVAIGGGVQGAILYQWRRNGVPIPGATASTYSLTASPADNGARFSVLISGFYDPVLSREATLTVE